MKDDPQTPQSGDLDSLAGEYVLGTLEEAGRRDVERRLSQEPALRAAVSRWESRLLPYSTLAEPLEPSAGLWTRIERSTAVAPASPPAESSASPWSTLWQSLTLWRGLTLASLAAVVALAVMPLNPTGGPEPRFMVVLTTPQHTQAGWIVQAASPRDIELIPTSSFTVPAGKSLQFWTKADDWSGPVSLGLVQPGESQRLTLDDLPPMEDNQLFELTLEDAGGSPLDRPTGPIQYIGRAVSI